MANDDFIESVAEAFARPPNGLAREPIYAFGQPRRRFADPGSMWVKITLSIVVGALLFFASSSGPKGASKRPPTATPAPAVRAVPARTVPERAGSPQAPPVTTAKALESPKTSR